MTINSIDRALNENLFWKVIFASKFMTIRIDGCFVVKATLLSFFQNFCNNNAHHVLICLVNINIYTLLLCTLI